MKTYNTLKNRLLILVLALFSISIYAKGESGKIYLSISHEIADYSKWKPGFDAHQSARSESGLTDIFVLQDINNTNSITAFFEVTDMKKAEAFLADPKLKEAMEKAGVTSTPEIVFYTSATEFGAINTSSLITTVSHSVKDFKVWKAVYDGAGEVRKNGGVHDYLILRSLADENVITVLGSSSSALKFNTFMSNPDLKGAMEKAGVTSKPVVKVLF